ncbi:hypothetical protein R1sor_013716 [Riccia sorocarpa]|uniref:Complex I assembly factor TIMMDC1, mitochondrial n=1 Tax=Riccia sorocarpa TaxID=122646 RepID=A0ABD3H7C9_9MARC
MASAGEFDDWGTKASFGVLAGMLYGGCKEALASSHYGEVLPPMQAGKDLRTQRFMWREMMEQRLIRITRGSILGGARLGVFTAIFCGAQWYYDRELGIHDTWNITSAGSTTAAAFGLALPGSVLSRLRAGALGSVLGAAFCLPLGYLQTSLKRQAEEARIDESFRDPSADPESSKVDGITATIRRLEMSLSDAPQQSSPDSSKSQYRGWWYKDLWRVEVAALVLVSMVLRISPSLF